VRADIRSKAIVDISGDGTVTIHDGRLPSLLDRLARNQRPFKPCQPVLPPWPPADTDPGPCGGVKVVMSRDMAVEAGGNSVANQANSLLRFPARVGTLTCMGSPSATAKEGIVTDLAAHQLDLTDNSDGCRLNVAIGLFESDDWKPG
jgi:hypothetical protein